MIRLLRILAADLLAGRPRVRRSTRWPAVRAAHLRREPTCRACGGSNDVEVHHVVPVHVAPSLELVESNLLTLCESPLRRCHLEVGHLKDWRRWNPDVRADAERQRRIEQPRPGPGD